MKILLSASELFDFVNGANNNKPVKLETENQVGYDSRLSVWAKTDAKRSALLQ